MKRLAIIGIVALFFALGTIFEFPGLVSHTDTKIVYQTVKEYVNNTIEIPVGQIYDKNISVYGIAVFNESGGGELVKITMLMRAGSGGLLLDVTDKTFGADFQDSLLIIKDYVESYTGTSLAYKDIILKLDTHAESIGGASGSAVIGIGLIAMLKNISLKQNTVVTGVLQPDGTLAPVSALDAKIDVAKSSGVTELLIPKVQCASVNESQKIGITVTCVNTINEALGRMSA